MEDFPQQLTQLLQQHFPGSTPELEQVKPLDKIGGYLLWEGFDGFEQLDRQRQLSRAIREHLSPEQAMQVTTIFTLTPVEADVIRQSQ